MKKAFSLFLSIALLAMLCSCGKNEKKSADKGGLTEITVDEIDLDGMDLEFTENDLKTDYSEDEITVPKAVDGVVTISSDGVYKISGSLSRVVVEASEKAKPHIILENAQISSEDGPAVYIKKAAKVFITVPSGTQSSLSDGKSYDSSFDNADGVIFGKSNLTINGEGRLNINGNYKCGIVSKDDLIIYKTEIVLNTSGTAIEGKDCVKLKEANITAEKCTDGIKSTNSEKKDKGFIYAESGTFNLTAQNDGIQAETALLIDGGKFNLVTGGGSANASDNNGKNDMPGGGRGERNNDNSSQNTENTKGLKSGIYTRIGGGEFNIDSADDAVHSDGSTEINGGSFKLSTGDDGIHSDEKLVFNGGNVTVSSSYEGIEAYEITFNDGNFDITAEDDGINAAGGGESSSGQTRENPFDSDPNAQIYINGGYILVNASGDGIDSNGDITVNGGTLLVSGPENGGNGALDCGGTAVINGGTAVVTGSSDMAVTFSSDSKQPSFMYNTEDYTEGGQSVCAVFDGKVIASFLPSKKYNSIVVSSPELKIGKTYTLNIGGSVSDCDENGFTENGKLDGESESYEIKLSSVSVTLGASGGMGGGMGGGKPNMPGGGFDKERPDGDIPNGNMPDGDMPNDFTPDKKPDKKPDSSSLPQTAGTAK